MTGKIIGSVNHIMKTSGALHNSLSSEMLAEHQDHVHMVYPAER